jgi:hypothetical protein
MMTNIRILVFSIVVLFFGCIDSNKQCNDISITQQVIPDKININLPKDWQNIDTSYITSPGLKKAIRYYSSDSSEYAYIEYYDLTGSNIPVNYDDLIEKQRITLRYFAKAINVKITQSDKRLNEYTIKFLKATYYDSVLKKESALGIGLVEGERKFCQLIIRTANKTTKDAMLKMDCILTSVSRQ